MRMHRNVKWSYTARNAHAPYCHVSWRPLSGFFTHYGINVTIFGETLLNTKCVLILCTILSEIFLILNITELYMTINVYRSARKVTIIIQTFLWNLNFLDRFWKILKSNNIEVHTVGAELFDADGRTDRQTDVTKLKIAICNFANGPKNQSVNAV